MNYPFETTKTGYPILDTEEKLQWYMNRLLHREVDLFYVNAAARDIATVYLRRRKYFCLQQANMSGIPDASPTFIEPDTYGIVDRSVVAVLRAIHARRDEEREQRRREAAIESNKVQQIKSAYRSWWKSLFKNGKEQE